MAVAIFFAFASPSIIHLLYGTAFSGAESILRIHIWTAIPVSLGVAYSTVLAAENAQIVTLYITLIGVAINVLLNWLLIPLLGTQGAAYATLASQWIVVLSTMLFRRSRRTGVAMLKSFVFR